MKDYSPKQSSKAEAIQRQGTTRRSTIRAGIAAALFGVVGVCSSVAAPIIDTFADASRVSSAQSLNSAQFDVSSGNLIVTPAETAPGTFGALNGQAIFIWSHDGGKFAGFTVDPHDEQSILQVSGIQNVTPQGANDAFMYGFIYLFEVGWANPVTHYFDVNPVNGNWSIDVYNAANMAFEGVIPDNLKWTVEFYIAAGGQDGVGYQFGEIAAIPEPGTTAMLLATGAGFLIWRRRNALHTAKQ